MTVYRPPALDKNVAIVDPLTGRMTPYLQRFWQNLSFVAADGANQNVSITALQTSVTTINGQITTINSSLATKAPLASPALTGTPTAPTAGGGTNTTQLATTAFVAAAIAPLAPLASPGLTGVPTAPTAAQGVSTTQLATTAYVVVQSVARATFTPWAAASGTAERTTFATYTAPAISAAPTQAEVQALADHMQIVSRRLKALVDDLKT